MSIMQGGDMLEGFRFWLQWRLSQEKVKALFPLVVQKEWFTIGGRLAIFQQPAITIVQVLNPDGVKTKSGFIPYGELGSIEAGGTLEFCAFIGTQILVRYTPPVESQVGGVWEESLVPEGTVFFLPRFWKDALDTVFFTRRWNISQLDEQARLREQVKQALSGQTTPHRYVGGDNLPFKRVATVLRQRLVGETFEEVVARAQKLPVGRKLELLMPFDGVFVDHLKISQQRSDLQKVLGSEFQVVEDYHNVRLVIIRLSSAVL